MSRCALVLLTRGRSLCAVVVLGALVGCSSAPRAELLNVTCDRVERGGELQAVTFDAAIAARGLAGQQVIYRVSVVDSRLRPLKSPDERFRDAAGNVAASKALMVPESPWTIENARVTIPVNELEIRTRDLPVLAEFSVCLASGKCLDRQTAMLPVYGSTEGRRAPRAPADRRRAKPGAVAKRAAPGAQKPVGRTRAPTTQPAEPPPDWWHDAVADTASLATEAMSALSPFGLVFGIGEADTPSERPTTRPTSQPTTTAPARVKAEPKPVAKQTEKPLPPYRLYVVQSGDTLWHIAARLLGDGARYDEILELNRDRLASPHELAVGTELRIPIQREEPPTKGGER